MRILILSFYFQPDLCAGSFRCSALVNKLLEHDNVELEVITTLPNRYSSFNTEAAAFEDGDRLKVHRIKLPAHNSGFVDQIKAFMAFYRGAKQIAKAKQYDAVCATSSRLFTAFLGARIAQAKGLPLYLDIRDIFVDTIKDVLPKGVALIAKPLFKLVERYTFSRALRINLVSEGFKGYFIKYYPKQEYRWFTNGIDEEFLKVGDYAKKTNENDKPLILYAGNIGEGQGLDTVIPRFAKALNGIVEFVIIGDGGKRQLLANSLVEDNIENVILLPPVNRSELIGWYKKADVLLLHLNDYPAFEKVLPSKIFEYAATGKPILAGVNGYAAKFLNDEVSNSEVFRPVDSKGAVNAFENLDMKVRPRKTFEAKYSRETIMAKMAKDIVDFASEKA